MSESANAKLVILFGGESPEHEISCTSACAIANVAVDRFAVELLAITKQGDWVRPEITDLKATAPHPCAPSLRSEGEPVEPYAELLRIRNEGGVVFPALHGPKGEDGTIQGMLELAGVAYVGCGVQASANCMDKLTTKEMLRSAGLPVTDWVRLDAPYFNTPSGNTTIRLDEMETIGNRLGWPVFVKPSRMGSSIGISKAHTPQEALAAVAEAAKHDSRLILEKNVTGREIECSLLGSDTLRASLPGEIIPSADFYTYEDKYIHSVAKLQIPAQLEPEEVSIIQDLSARAGKLLGVEGLARVDFMFDDRLGPLINEINTMPGFTPISLFPKTWEASGVSYADLIDEVVRLGWERKKRRAVVAPQLS